MVGYFSNSRKPRDYLGELPPGSLVALARVLRLRPEDHIAEPSEEWLARQRAEIAALPAELKRQSSTAWFLRLGHGRPQLCAAHRPLSYDLILWCFHEIALECSGRVDRIRAFCRAFPRDADTRHPLVRGFLKRLSSIASLYMSSTDFDTHFGDGALPCHARLPEIRSGCPACVLAAVGAQPALLVDLRANLLSRARHHTPRFLALVDAWILAAGQEHVRPMEAASLTLHDHLLTIRVIMSERRRDKIAEESPERRKRREARERARRTKSSSHRGGLPRDLKMLKGRAGKVPLPQVRMKSGPREIAIGAGSEETDVDTLYQRIYADVLVESGPNPELIPSPPEGEMPSDETVCEDPPQRGYAMNGGDPAVVPGADGYRASVLQRGFDGRGGFCHGYGMEPPFREYTPSQARVDSPTIPACLGVDRHVDQPRPPGVNTPMVTEAVPGTSRPSAIPTDKRDLSCAPSVGSYVPARRDWWNSGQISQQHMPQQYSGYGVATNPIGQDLSASAKCPADDDSDDSCNGNGNGNDDDDDDQYTSEVETVAGPSATDDQQNYSHSHHHLPATVQAATWAFPPGIGSIRASSIYSTDRLRPPAARRDGDDSDRNAGRASRDQERSRIPSPQDYADAQTEISRRFGYASGATAYTTLHLGEDDTAPEPAAVPEDNLRGKESEKSRGEQRGRARQPSDAGTRWEDFMP